jgi:hypothetical protein
MGRYHIDTIWTEEIGDYQEVWIANEADRQEPQGMGKTENEAIADLLRKMADQLIGGKSL